MNASAQRVADRYHVRLVVRQVCDQPSFQTRTAALRDLTPEVLAAFAEGFWLPMHQGQLHKTAVFRGLVKKVKSLWQAFKRAPARLWTKFKEMLGIKGITDIPRAIKDAAKKGWKALRKVFAKAFTVWPLKIFTIPEGASFGLNAQLDRIMAKFPGFKRFLDTKAKPFLKTLDQFLRKWLPGVAPVIFTYIYITIWMNVVEFEWNFNDLVAGFTGGMSLADLIGSLPGSGLGFLMNGFGFGTWTLLPMALAARILYCLSVRLVMWRNGRFEVNQEAVAEVVGAAPAEVPA
jgi:hypothetical protein